VGETVGELSGLALGDGATVGVGVGETTIGAASLGVNRRYTRAAAATAQIR
jgi:hypothetical protein